MEYKIRFNYQPAAGDYLRFKLNGVTKTFTFFQINWSNVGTHISFTLPFDPEANTINTTSNADGFIRSDLNLTWDNVFSSIVDGDTRGYFTFKDTATNIFTDIEFSSGYASFASEVEFSPSTIAFNHTQGSSLPSKTISVSGNSWKIIGKPNFILSSPTTGVTITNDTVGGFQTISGSNNADIVITLGGFYNGNTIFSSADLAGNFEVQKENVFKGNIAFTVVVNKISDFLTIPYPNGTNAFTLDTKYFEVFSAATDTYFQFDTTIKVYDFFTNTETIHTLYQKLVLFKGKSKVNIGKLIHRLMDNFELPNATLLQYKIAEAQIVCAEKKQIDNSVVRSGTSSVVKFVAGLSRGITTIGFLDFNPKMNRVTKNSFEYLNVLIPSGNYELRIFKNNAVDSTVSLPASDGKIVCKKVTFENFNQGDVIDYVLDVVGGTSTAIKKSFVLFPEGMYSNTLVWENEFLLQSALECTGSASIKSDIEFQSQKIYEDFVEKLNHLSSSKEVRFTINTGWLMQSDVDTIESLMRSKRVWFTKGSETIGLRPIGKAIVNQDTERELIDFTLEFIINRNYDEETYTL